MVVDQEKEEEFKKEHLSVTKKLSELIKPTKMEVNVDESNGRIASL